MDTLETLVELLQNRILIIDGKRLPHERRAIGPGQRVAVTSGCFRIPHD